MSLDRPIFVIGPGRSGTSLLCGLINWHPDVGPKCEEMTKHVTIQSFISSFIGHAGNLSNPYVKTIEHNSLWERMFPMIFRGSVDGRLENHQIYKVENEIRRGCNTKRFVCKIIGAQHCLGSFRSTWPDCKIVCTLRDPISIFYSTAFIIRNIQGGNVFITERINGITEILYKLVKETDLFIRYEDLCEDVSGVMRTVCDFCEIPYSPNYDNLVMSKDRNSSARSLLKELHLFEWAEEHVKPSIDLTNDIIKKAGIKEGY